MSEIIRTRDVIVHAMTDAFTVAVDGAMIAGGWAGGQGVRWVDSPKDEFLMTYSDGRYGGFLLWGSDESSDQFISIVGQQVKYGYGVFCAGSWLISTSTYEKYTYASRVAGPLVPITYAAGDRLRFSLRGLWTKEDEWTPSGDPRAPNDFVIANVVQPPRASNNNYLVVHTFI